MSERLEWKLHDGGDGWILVTFKGSVDEDADFKALTNELKDRKRIRFDLSGIARINSCGVREWVNFVRSLPESCSVELEKCTPAVVSQLNMISNFAGTARILSVQAPFVCDNCGNEEVVLVATERGQVPAMSQTKCSSCGGQMEFDDIEDSYFAFLN